MPDDERQGVLDAMKTVPGSEPTSHGRPRDRQRTVGRCRRGRRLTPQSSTLRSRIRP